MKIEDMISANRADCCGCEACANICPKNAIEMIRDAEGFAYPKINAELCIKCGRCDATCPSLNYVENFPDDFPPTFVATYPDDKILRHSSSGGIFTALSEIIFNNDGIVFGAAFDKKWHVYHTAARTLDELENLRGRKYTQSQIGDVYRQVRDALKSTQVLFSGTPCQCAGLKHFLGGDHENLLTVDILCQGVPSPAVWENYIGELRCRNDIAHVNFRSKRTGWTNFSMEINYFDRAHYICKFGDNLYGKLFIKALMSRPSCNGCKFKIPHGQSDLSLGDAWGVTKFAPEMFDDRGTSVVFIHTTKGKEFFFERMNLRTQRVRFIDATYHNVSSIIAKTVDERREKFFADFTANSDTFAVMEKYYYQDDTEIRNKVNKQNRAAWHTNYRSFAAHIRKKFEQSILIVATFRDRDELKILAEPFEQRYPNCDLFFLKVNDKGQIACKEYFSLMDFPQKDAAALADFSKQNNVTEVFVEEPPKFDSPVVKDWLNGCGLPVEIFPRP